MRERVRLLRSKSLEAVPELCSERALLVTEFYGSPGASELTPPQLRAGAFRHFLLRRELYIGVGELIVGEKGNRPKATPTYPELCCHTLSDLEILDIRESIPFRVSPDTRRAYAEVIIPFWRGRSQRERIFAAMTGPWQECYDSGVFTEFMEQRSPGHTVLDDKIYRRGLLDLIGDIEMSMTKLDPRGARCEARLDELRAMRTCAEAVITFAERHADLAEKMAAESGDGPLAEELLEIARICRRVPAHPPDSFREGLQSYWFVHLGVTTELNPWDAFSPGHLDRHLLPFYLKDVEEGRLTREDAEELLQCFWIKFNNQPAPPKVGITAMESGTYTDFAQIGVGGILRDGTDGVSELTYMILDVVEEMRLLQPSASVQVAAVNPDDLLLRAARIIRTGFGQPSLFNADRIVEELLRQGKTLEDARDGGSSGCIEVGAFGRENYNLSGYLNLPKILEITLNDGLDPLTGKRLGPSTGDPVEMISTEDLFTAFRRQLNHFVDIKVAGNLVIERLFAEHMPAPFLSLLISDCIEKGLDYHAGGARYNTTYIQGVGIGSLTDSVSAIHHHVFTSGELDMRGMLELLARDFQGGERVRMMLLNRTPRYGNDDPRVDGIMERLFRIFLDSVEGRSNFRGGKYHINMLPTTSHIYFGSVTGALPDGRRAGRPLSEGISPVQGADRKGPTAVLRSAARMDHHLTGGTLLNQKLTPSLLETDDDLWKLVHLVRTYFEMGGHHIQFNVVDRETLLEAQRDPASHRDLVVRVAGYSDYFCDLGKALQDEILERTEQGAL